MKKEVAPEQKTSSVLDIDELWKKYHEGKRNENGKLYRNQLIEHYRNLVRYAAERLHSKFCNVELDDLISASIFGLKDAIEGYDPNRGVKFETYASPIIKCSIIDELRAMDWTPKLVRKRVRQLEKAKSRLESKLVRKPTDKELIKELAKKNYSDPIRFKIKKAKIIINEARNIKKIFSLYEYYKEEYEYYKEDDEGNDLSKTDYLEDKKSPNPVTEAQKEDLKEILTEGLTRAERLIIVLYYYEEMTMKEIGATIDLSESRVSQIHKSILKRLKDGLTTRRLNLEDCLIS